MIKTRIVTVQDEELREALRAMGENVEMVLRAAGEAGVMVVVDEANRLAPGPHIGYEIVGQGADYIDFEIGPDRDHWYYKFFETGTQPHEVNVEVKQALRLYQAQAGTGTGYAERVSVRGVAARPFLRPAIKQADKIRAKIGDVLRAAVMRSAR